MTVDRFAQLGQEQHWPDLKNTDAVTTHYHLLVATGHKEGDNGGNDLRNKWSKQNHSVRLSEPDDSVWQAIAEPTFDLAILPNYSFSISFIFRLLKPYISKDDRQFYIIDNPIVRDKVFQLPMVRPSSWKGNLYSALWQLGYNREDDALIQRLFGDIRDNDKGLAGRLRFFPTFFNRVSLEVINPHDRTRRVGKNPILFEAVPAKTTGLFNLLYVPFDQIGQDQTKIKAQISEELPILAEGLEAMFCAYGFSAKRTSGYGVAEANLVGEGKLILKTPAPLMLGDVKTSAKDPAEVQFETDITNFLTQNELAEFPRWTKKELQASGWGKKRQSRYKKLRQRHPNWNEATHEWQVVNVEQEAPETSLPVNEIIFNSFGEMKTEFEKLAQIIVEGMENE